MNRRTKKIAAVLVIWTLALTAGALAGCGDETPAGWDEPLEISEPLEAGDRLVYLNRTLEQVQVLEPARSGDSFKLRDTRVPTGAEPTELALSTDDSKLFVINSGDETLGIYDLSGEDIERQTVDIDSAYDQITVDPAGEFVLLSFSGSPGSGCVACNLNEIGVVDLRGDEPTATFDTLNKRAEELVFAESFELAGGQQRLAAALSPSQITVIDLKALLEGDRQNGLREVPLTKSQAEQVKDPEQAVFDVTPDTEGSETIHLYVRTRGSDDVTQVSIKPSARMDAERKFDVSVNQLAAGNSPAAMTVLDLESGTRLLTLDGQRPRFHLVDVKSGEGSSFALPMNATADDLLVYETVVETGDGNEGPETRVLASSTSSPLVAVIRPSTISITGDNPTVGRSVEAIRLDGVPRVIRRDETVEFERAIAIHSGNQAGFSVLNLQPGENSAVFIQGASLSDLTFASSVAWGVFQGKENFGRFDLERGHPTVFELPAPGQRIFLDREEQLVVVEHASQIGEFTVVDANDPAPQNGKLFQGIFLQDLFTQPIPDRATEE